MSGSKFFEPSLSTLYSRYSTFPQTVIRHWLQHQHRNQLCFSKVSNCSIATGLLNRYLWVILLERAGHAVSDAGHLIDQTATLFDGRCQFPHGNALQLDGLKFLWMAEHDIQRYFSVSRIVLGTTWSEGFPVFC